MNTLNIALCEGRHEISGAIDGSIFATGIQDVTNTAHLENKAFDGIWNACYRHYRNGESGYLMSDPDWDGEDAEPLVICKGIKVNLYVTGLTVALIAALNVCKQEGLNVTLWHYNRETDNYYPQTVA